jgi:hypothetical protein
MALPLDSEDSPDSRITQKKAGLRIVARHDFGNNNRKQPDSTFVDAPPQKASGGPAIRRRLARAKLLGRFQHEQLHSFGKTGP